MPVIYPNKIKVESKWHQFTTKAKEKAMAAARWIHDNPDTVALVTTIGGALIGGGIKITKSAIRSHNLKKEQFNKERYIYDHSLGMYLRTRRPLRNNDYVIINARRANGERLSDILVSMRLLE